MRRSVVCISTPPGARGSTRTTPVTSTDVSCVSFSNESQTPDPTSLFKSTACIKPVPSRTTTNAIFPLERVVVTQPRTATVCPASGGSASIQ